MTQLTLNKIGLPHLPMRCPHCRELHTIKVRHTQPFLVRCHYCQKRSVVKLLSAKQANRLNLRLAVEAIKGEAFHE